MTMLRRTSPLLPRGAVGWALTRIASPPALPTESTISPFASSVSDSPSSRTRLITVSPSARASTQQLCWAVIVRMRLSPAGEGAGAGGGETRAPGGTTAPPRPGGGAAPRRRWLALGLWLAVSQQELGHHALGVEAEELRVLPHEGTREQAAGEDLHSVVLQGLQEAKADLGAVRDLPQADAPQLALSAKVPAKGRHGSPALSAIHGPSRPR